MNDYKILIEYKKGETSIEIQGSQIDLAYGLCEAMRRSEDFKEMIKVALYALDKMSGGINETTNR